MSPQKRNLAEASPPPPPRAPRRIAPEPLVLEPPLLRFIPLPEARPDGSWAWDGLEARPDPRGRGSGLFATRNIRAGLLIPYTGKLVPTALVHDGDYKTSHTHDGDYGWSTDARAEPECRDLYCVAAYANEASELSVAERLSRAPEERYSCKFVELACPEDYMTVPHLPAYKQTADGDALWDRMHQPFVMVCAHVAAGEQLFLFYEGGEPEGYGRLPLVGANGVYVNIKDPFTFARTIRAFEQATAWTVAIPAAAA